jgi:hypothetical protein
MRTLVDIIGGLFVALGIICVLGGSMVPTVNPGVDIVLWTGVVMILLGWLICYLAGRTTCPQCGGLAKFKALKCKHCGAESAAER